MVFKREPPPDYEVWHDWFAWWPIDIDDCTVWLQVVERRRSYYRSYDGWEYRFKDPLDPGFAVV